MSPQERVRALELRRARHLPWHSPPHLDLQGTRQYLISAACYEHHHIIGKSALQLDPLSLLVTVDNNVPHVLSKQYDRGLEFAHKGEEMDSNFFLAHFVEGWIYGKKGDYQKAIAKLQRAQQLEDQPWISSWLGHAYAASGDRQNAQKIINDLSNLSKQRYVSPYFTAEVYAGLKDKEKTIEYLEKAYEDKSVWLVWLKVEEIFDFLRADPRFQELQRRVGPPQ